MVTIISASEDSLKSQTQPLKLTSLGTIAPRNVQRVKFVVLSTLELAWQAGTVSLGRKVSINTHHSLDT